jgi:hypothetical protein
MADVHEPVTSPAQLPDFRLWLLDQWRPGAVFDQIWQLSRDPFQVSAATFTLDGRFDFRCLEEASLWWVTADMIDLIQQAAPMLPPTTLTEDLLPAEVGLVVFEKPLVGRDAEIPDHQVTTDAVVWGRVNLIEDPLRPYISLSSYSYRDFGNIIGKVITTAGVPLGVQEQCIWSPMGRTDWGFGTDTDTPTYEADIHSRRNESMAEDRRWFASFCLLAAQRNVAERHELEPPRHVRRRSERRSVSSTVNLIDVRRRGQSTSPGEGREVNWSHRWIVNGFWRQQPYGPGRKFRRPQYILPYIKGPQDKPLIVKDRVNVVKR